MLKTQSILIITRTVRNNLTKSALGSFSQTAWKPKTSSLSPCFESKCLLQQVSVFNATKKNCLSKLSNVSMTKDAPSLADTLLDEFADIDDENRKQEVLSLLKLLISRGCSEEDIKTKCRSYIISPQSSYIKVKFLTDLHPNIVMLMPLLSCHIVSLRRASKHACHDNNNIGFPNRIEYLSHHFEVKPAELITVLSKHPSLLTMPFHRLENKMTILKQAQISSEYILKDLWIFNYNERLLESRISVALKAKVELKPWMLRCSEVFFESLLSKRSQTQNILKEGDEIDYLAKKLNCSEDYVKVIMEKNKLLKTINIPKLDQVLSFLFDKGYTPQEIRLFPRIFCSSVQTLNKRFESLRKLRNTLPTMSQLCMSSKNFENSQAKEHSSKKEETE